MQGTRTRNFLGVIGPHVVTMVLTLIVAAFVFNGRDGRSASDGPIFREAARPPLPSSPPEGRSPEAPAPVDRPGIVDVGGNADELNNIGVYESVNRAVVNISTSATVRGLFQDAEVSGSGSGFVINDDGYILTNHHVVEGADVVQVGLFDGSVLDARVVGTDPSNDVAVIRVSAPAETLFPVVLGESSDLRVGQKVLALGNPFGLERTLTTGIVSSLDRSLEAQNGRMIRGVIQTDASINPGNSGGPLLNARGEVIGMTTAIYSKVGQSAGIGFAVPITMIKRVLRPLVEQGFVERATLGISRVYSLDQGLLVLGVEPGGPADRAGIRPLRVRYVREGPFVRARIDPDSADVIRAIDGIRVESVSEMLTEVESHAPGETITVTVLRNGGSEEIEVPLGRTIIR
ncbi:S1C family serine protease [Tautonia plasticadhaerens]|uniref:Serine protease HtrA n=1 Tax=Tautonia plasticadhaerens TaxID=2527974 RepID=A0A518GXJ7_9BACT|nr:trypsin-like peptidase domain-containing protein [Tautonia plasticadhaerens]QDV33311.1 Putative serine protease HtrA [Tautonia plasticadhaerens]